MLPILYPYILSLSVLHSADKVNYIHKHSSPAPLPWHWEGGMEEEGLEVYRSQAWSTSVRSRSLGRRKGQRKGSLSLSQCIKREILLPLLQGISVICLPQCPTTLVCFVVSSFSLNIPCWSCLTGAVCCVFGLYQCVPMIHGTMHLFSSPLNVPSQRSARLHPQARTPAPSDLQLSCSFSNLELLPLVFSCLLLFCAHLHFLLPSFTQVSKALFVILCFALVFQDFWIASVAFILLALNFTFQPVHSRRLSVLLTILKPSLSTASVGVPVKGILLHKLTFCYPLLTFMSFFKFKWLFLFAWNTKWDMLLNFHASLLRTEKKHTWMVGCQVPKW